MRKGNAKGGLKRTYTCQGLPREYLQKRINEIQKALEEGTINKSNGEGLLSDLKASLARTIRDEEPCRDVDDGGPAAQEPEDDGDNVGTTAQAAPDIEITGTTH